MRGHALQIPLPRRGGSRSETGWFGRTLRKPQVHKKTPRNPSIVFDGPPDESADTHSKFPSLGGVARAARRGGLKYGEF